ncbi:unnamed protein product (macronuclear) [Paramecium tetraurelia]|uniref:PH domain-containing protein n=1 Tax=Paramecium tetraurelia TaxID=5888 RepID=A0CYH2_PARTE|nr:uncharacterized protein GSPATT00011439001 [Paramecium tetraurelia]CAK75839.1 unnamed protein product [Paramecium tetraurelia]|eukprot:XP_001443236.1 hypothetical protein (macronuclear) [Paramecium tetraurelia strain d4-2]
MSLLQLERSYLDALSEFGQHAPKTIQACVTLIETLNQTGQYQIKQNQPGEKYFQRATELAAGLQSEELLDVKYFTYMLYAEYMERDHNNKQAYNLLIQLLPLQKTNQKPIIMTQIQILNHVIENGRLCKIASVASLNEKLLNLMEEIGLTFYLQKQFSKKFQLILLQALSFQAKIYHKQNKDSQAAQLYFQSFHLSEQLLGIHEKRTQEYKKLYEQLSDKISVNIEIQSQDECEDDQPQQLQVTPREEILKSFRPKITSFNNYIINVDSARAPKPSKKVDKSNKLTTSSSNNKPTILIKPTPLSSLFIIKDHSKRPTSSQGTTKLTSPTRGASFLSKKNTERFHHKMPSLEQSAIKELDDTLPPNLTNELLITRPQYEVKPYKRIEFYKQHTSRQTTSTYQIQLTIPTRPQIREPSKNTITSKMDVKKISNTPSTQKIERPSQKKILAPEIQPTVLNIKPIGSTKNLTNDNDEDITKQEENKVLSFEGDEPIKVISPQDSIIAKYLETHPMEKLLEAVERIKGKLRKYVQYSHNRKIEMQERKHQHSPGRVIMSNKQQQLNRSNTLIDIVEKKLLENEASKIIYKFFQSSNTMEWYPVHFYDKLFTDFETSKWTLENPRIRGQFLHKSSKTDDCQQINLEQIQNILFNLQRHSTLQVIGSIEISNHTRKIQFRFIIDTLVEHYKDIQTYDDMMDLFDQLLNIYLMQEDLFSEWLDNRKEQTLYRVSKGRVSQAGQKRQSINIEFTKERRIELQDNMQFYQYLLSKVLFLIKRMSYIKTMNGYKFKSVPQNQQVSIQQYNNQIYYKKLERISNYFQYLDCEIQHQRSKPILSQKRHRKRNKDRHLFIAQERKQTIIREATSPAQDDESQQHSQRGSPYISLKDTGIIIGNELQSRQLILGGETPLIQPQLKQPGKSNWKNIAHQEAPPQLIDIFTLETQDYLQRYFPEFRLNTPPIDYHPSPAPNIKKLLTESQYHFRQEVPSKKYVKLEYKPIHLENYLILTQVVKIDQQFYYLTLTDKLQLKQIFGKDLWEDQLEIQLKELINYNVGRTGYIIDLIELQNILQSKLQIVNCRIQIKQDETDNSYQKKLNKILRVNKRLYQVIQSIEFIEEGLKEMSQESNSQQEDGVELIEEQKREPLIDIVFILGILNNNNYVEYMNYLPSCYLLKNSNGKFMLQDPEQPRKPKFPYRLILSHEDMNKHISRTNEQTINAKDITLFPHYNSVFLIRQQQFIYKPIGVKLRILTDLKKLHQDFRNGQSKAHLLIYYNNHKKIFLKLNSEQTEKWAHLFQIDGCMRWHILNYKTKLKKTLVGFKLYQNENRVSQSKDPRFLLMQDKLTQAKQYFIQTKIKSIGCVFVCVKIHSSIMLMRIMPAGNKSKSHLFIFQIDQQDPIKLTYTLCKQFILKTTQTYSKLELMPITKNQIRKQYLLSNQYHDNNVLIGQKSYSRVVYKQVKKIDKSYFIITVTLIKNYFQIYLYNQNTCRRFYFTIHRSDFLIMNQYFLDSIFPEQPHEVVEQFFRPWKLNEILKIYSLIKKAPETFRNRTQLYLQQMSQTKKLLKRSATSNFSSASVIQRQSTLQLNQLLEELNEDKLNKSCWLFDKLLLRKSNSVFENKLWMEIIKQMNINQNQIVLDTFKTVLSELVYFNDRTCNFLCYIPCQEIQQSFRWQPIRLRIHSYDTCKTIDVPLNIRGKQVQVYKLGSSLYLNYQSKQEIPSNQEIMKVNKNNDSEYIKYQLLYKGAFMKHKMLFITIYLYNEVFRIRIFSQTNSISRKLDVNQVELKIPYIRQLLILNPYEAGRRLSIIYRNNFIHASFLKL